MVKRSLQGSVTGIEQAKKAFAHKGWTQENLAFEVNLKTRQPIWRFFSGRPVERHIFIEICSVLSLNWWEIAANPPEEFSESKELGPSEFLDIDALVQQVRLPSIETLSITGTSAHSNSKYCNNITMPISCLSIASIATVR